MTDLRYDGEQYRLAEGWDAAKVAETVREARLTALSRGSEGVPFATFDLQGGKKVMLLVDPGIPFAVEVPNPNPRGSVVIR